MQSKLSNPKICNPVKGVGIEPTFSSFQGWRIASFLPPEVAEVGVEPTTMHQALDLAAFPVCVLGHAQESGDCHDALAITPGS